MKTFVSIICIIFCLTVWTIVAVKYVSLQRNCVGYLKRAADANTISTAAEQLDKAIAYMEANNLTHGYTSVLYTTPDEDIAFWYNNIVASRAELAKTDSTTSMLEQSNMLIKLRETLLDAGEHKDHITCPDGLSRYPNNLGWGLALIGTVACLALLFIALFTYFD
jgi:hypothetical protein